MNPIISILHNNMQLSKRALRSFEAQDIPVKILLVDNGSTDGTAAWLRTERSISIMTLKQEPLASAWNRALRHFFIEYGCNHALVVNNDVELRPDTYRHLLADGGGFVTAIGTKDPEKIKPSYTEDTCLAPFFKNHYASPDPEKKRPHPDFSCFLIRRETFEKVGPFDENFLRAYCEDADYHCRMHRAGIKAEALELPFLHFAAQTVQNAGTHEAKRIQLQADLNRKYFRDKWGFSVGSPEYYKWFGSNAPTSEDSAL